MSVGKLMAGGVALLGLGILVYSIMGEGRIAAPSAHDASSPWIHEGRPRSASGVPLDVSVSGRQETTPTTLQTLPAGEVITPPSVPASLSTLEELLATLESNRQQLQRLQDDAVEELLAAGVFEVSYEQTPVKLGSYSNRELPTTVEITPVQGTDISEVRVVTLTRENYPEICTLYDRVRTQQAEVWAREKQEPASLTTDR